MDVFSRTFLPAAVEAGVTPPTVSRHMPVFARCVGSGDATVLVTRCTRLDRPGQGDYLLLLTYQRLVVTQQTRLLRRLRLHLNTELRHLSNVTWNADPRLGVELAATAVDGIRERFLIRVGQPKQVWHLDALLGNVFRDRVPAYPAPAPWTTPLAPPPRTAPFAPAAWTPATAPPPAEVRTPALNPAVAI
jgi:hypothetical protein